jgi:hypothetical protein
VVADNNPGIEEQLYRIDQVRLWSKGRKISPEAFYLSGMPCDFHDHLVLNQTGQ